MKTLKYRSNIHKIKSLSKHKRFDLFKVTPTATFKECGVIIQDSEWNYEKPNKSRSEEIFIHGVNSSGSVLIIRFQRLPQEDKQCLNVATLVYKVGETIYDYEGVELVNNEHVESYKTAALDIQVIAPFRLIRIVFRGILMKKLNGNQEEIFTKIRMFWYPLSKVIDFKRANKASFIAKDIGNADIDVDDLFEDRYEQFGEIKGTIQFESNALEKVFFWGSKSKKFNDNKPHNNRTWKRMFGFSKKGLCFQFGFSIDNVFNKSFRYGFLHRGLVNSSPIIKSSLALCDYEKLNSVEEIHLTAVGPLVFDVILKETEQIKDWCVVRKAMINDVTANCLILEENSFINSEKLKTKAKERIISPEINIDGNALTLDLYGNNWSSICGGKGASLSLLWYLSQENLMDVETPNFIVPRGLVVTTNAYKLFLDENPAITEAVTKLQTDVWNRKIENFNEECEKVVSLIQNTVLSPKVKDEIRNRIISIFGDEAQHENVLFAVRSSASGEDSEEMSGAGQMESYLGVKGIENIYTSAVKCWASQFTHIAVQYKHGYGQLINTPMAVVIQEMVDCDVAGVLFTCDPLTGDPRKVTITANYGLCESVVSGSAEPDTITVLVNPVEEKVEKVESVLVGSKKLFVKVSKSGDGGTENNPVTPNEGRTCCLEDEEIIQITKVALLLRRCFGNERDVEWGFKDNHIYLLQCRPVTNLDLFSDWEIMHQMDRAVSSEDCYISKANVGEVLPGSTSFFGNDFVCGLFGLPGAIRFNRAGLDGTEFYCPYVSPGWVTVYNQIFFDVSGLNIVMPTKKASPLRRAMHYSFFGHEVDDEYFIPVDKRVTPRMNFNTKIKAGIFFGGEVFRCAPRLKKEYKNYGNFKLLDENKVFKTSQELFNFITDSTYLFFDPFFRHGECSGKSSATYAAIFSILAKNKDVSPDLMKDIALLLSNNTDVISVELPRQLQRVAESIEDKESFSKMSDEEALQCLMNGDSEASKKFRQFLEMHGHRGYKEFDVMYLQTEDDPLPSVRSIKNMLKTGHTFIEKKLLTPDEIVASLKTELSGTQKLMLRKMILPWSQEGVGQRERSKSLVIKVMQHFRKAFWILAEMMEKEGRIPDKELMFYLRINEVATLMNERNATFIARAKHRKKLFPKMDQFQFEEMTPGPDFAPRNENDDCIVTKELLNCDKVTGLTVCIGKVEGRAAVCRNFGDVGNIRPGDILIAYGTDVGWSPYFPLLSGVVTEIGGLISHGAVIAREYGLPCIIAAKNVTRIFENGDQVILDAENGVLYKKSSHSQ